MAQNWALLVCTSRFWFNYRHIANTLSLYRTVKHFGIPDTQIILMLADDIACNARNVLPGRVFNNADHSLELYSENVEVDYRGVDVTAENFLRLLHGRHPADTPSSKRLGTDNLSNLFVYLSGHGGSGFLKFQDSQEISGWDVSNAFEQMRVQGRFHEIFFMVDTCQANTLFTQFISPNVMSLGSSRAGQNSYSHHGDLDIGIAIIDRFTYWSLQFFEEQSFRRRSPFLLQTDAFVGMRVFPTVSDDALPHTNLSVGRLLRSYDPRLLFANPGFDATRMKRRMDAVALSDFLCAAGVADDYRVALAPCGSNASPYEGYGVLNGPRLIGRVRHRLPGSRSVSLLPCTYATMKSARTRVRDFFAICESGAVPSTRRTGINFALRHLPAGDNFIAGNAADDAWDSQVGVVPAWSVVQRGAGRTMAFGGAVIDPEIHVLCAIILFVHLVTRCGTLWHVFARRAFQLLHQRVMRESSRPLPRSLWRFV